ncbi:MAG: RNA polymerase sigma factor [Candidatus Paceibacterota bacterium]
MGDIVEDDMKNKTDKELAEFTQKGNTEAFGILVERYEHKLLRYGRKFLFDYEDIKDAIQDVFVRAYSNIQSFDRTREFSPWIYRIAHNNFVNIIKKKKKEPYIFFDADMIFSLADEEEILTRAEKEEERRDIDRCLKEIKPKYREILILFYFEEKDYKEISDILSIPISTVGVRLKRGRKEIKKIYEQRKK